MTSSGKGSPPKRASPRSSRSARTTRNSLESPRSDFEELFVCLNAHRARYLIVGGYAVAFHARPRYTKDIDLFIDRSRANARRVHGALQQFFGGSLQQVVAADFVRPDGILVLGVAPNRVDILNAIPGVEFSSCWKRRVISSYGAALVAFISKDDLVRNKETSGRPIDKRDVTWLRKAP